MGFINEIWTVMAGVVNISVDMLWCNLHSQMLLYKTSRLLNISKSLNKYYLAESRHSPSKPQKPVHFLDLDRYEQAVVFSLQTCQSFHNKRPGHVYDCCWFINVHIVGIQNYLHLLINCFQRVTYKNIPSTPKIKINVIHRRFSLPNLRLLTLAC